MQKSGGEDNMQIFVFNFDQNAKLPETKYVYHGTRAPENLILKGGLVFPGVEFLMQMISKSFEEVGMSFDAWVDYQKVWRSKGHLTTLGEISRENRKVIWVTDNESNAWNYAHRSPEIVTEAIRNEYIRLHSRRKHVIEETEKIITDATAWMEPPHVVVIDAKKIGANVGCNQPIAPVIPREAIIEVKNIQNANY
jgi:hypothetical protein